MYDYRCKPLLDLSRTIIRYLSEKAYIVSDITF